MESFLDCVRSHLSLMPDYKPKGLVELIKPKCKVLYFPIQVRHQLKPAEALKNECTSNTSGPAAAVSEADKHHCTAIESHTLHSSDKTVRGFPPAPLHIVWPHRWYIAPALTPTTLLCHSACCMCVWLSVCVRLTCVRLTVCVCTKGNTTKGLRNSVPFW